MNRSLLLLCVAALTLSVGACSHQQANSLGEHAAERHDDPDYSSARSDGAAGQCSELAAWWCTGADAAAAAEHQPESERPAAPGNSAAEQRQPAAPIT